MTVNSLSLKLAGHRVHSYASSAKFTLRVNTAGLGYFQNQEKKSSSVLKGKQILEKIWSSKH